MNYSIEILMNELGVQKSIVKILRDSTNYSEYYSEYSKRERKALDKIIQLEEAIELLEEINL